MKTITKEIQDFIDKNTKIIKSDIPDDDGDIYVSSFDNSYLTRVGMEDDFEFYTKRGISEQIQHTGGKTACIGFNPVEKKWYGWSHRACYGFTIGSECKKGDCHYQADNPDAFIAGCLRFWGNNEGHAEFGVDEVVEEYYNEGPKPGAKVWWRYNNKVPNKSLHGTVGGHFEPFPDKWGKGEWTAKTMADAKTMARDFAEGVS